MTASRVHVVLAGGGTGGHIIPAVAVADEIVKRGGSVRFVGTRGRIEEKFVPAAGYGIDFIDVKPLAGGGLSRKLLGVSSVPVSLYRSLCLLSTASPNVVVGVGGYVAGPVVLAARLLGIQTAFLEQNATLGLANQLLKRVVHRGFVAYEETCQALPGGKGIVTGNPVKQAIIDASGRKNRQSERVVRILVMGGSQGARAIDERVPAALASLGMGDKLSVLHQGQATNLDTVRRLYRDAEIDAVAVPFIDDMATAYANADVVIARSGATTVAETTVMGLCAVFLPYPHHKDEQQKKNAAPMVAKDAAIVVDESSTGVKEMAEAIAHFVKDPTRRQAAQDASRTLGRPDAASDIVDHIFQMAGH